MEAPVRGGAARAAGKEGLAVDPVCGREVEVARCALRSVVGGRAFYLCSPECKDAFDRDPLRYAAVKHGTGPE